MNLDTPQQQTGYLFDGRTLRLDWGNREGLNLHLSGSLLNRIEKATGKNEQEFLHLLGGYINSVVQGAS